MVLQFPPHFLHVLLSHNQKVEVIHNLKDELIVLSECLDNLSGKSLAKFIRLQN